MPTVFNAANEKAVSLFLDRRIGYLEIAEMIETCMQEHHNIKDPSLEDILAVEQDVYRQIEKRMK